MSKELTKRLVEKMLNSEMQNYLGYEKNQHNNSDNARNGINSKKLITKQGKIEINVPLGYQGIQNIYKNTIIPIKRTKNKKLTKQEIKYNKIVSKIRIKVEHVFAWLKRFKILVNKSIKSKFRLMYLRFNLLCEIFIELI